MNRERSVESSPMASGRAALAAPFSSLAMYPFEELRASWDVLYGALARDVAGAPDGLRWDLDARDTWLSPQLAMGMACGWPLITELANRVRVVGTFAYRLDGGSSHTYRSVIIARRRATVVELANSTLALNSSDSLSGYVSLVSLLPTDEPGWSGPTVETGSHLASIEAVRSGLADIASIDALTWAYTKRGAPHLLSDLAVIDRGPPVPHLPLIANVHTTDDTLAEWRTAISAAIDDPSLSDTLDRLLIEGFVPLDLGDYEAAVGPLRRAGVSSRHIDAAAEASEPHRGAWT